MAANDTKPQRNVCCCRIEKKDLSHCSGNAGNGQRKYFYEAADPRIDNREAAASHTCYPQRLCCHMFKKSCQIKGTFFGKDRYHMKNVDERLCTSMPEVAESMFTKTPEQMFGVDQNGDERPAFL